MTVKSEWPHEEAHGHAEDLGGKSKTAMLVHSCCVPLCTKFHLGKVGLGLVALHLLCHEVPIIVALVWSWLAR